MELLEPIIQDQKQIWEQNGWQADIQEGIQKDRILSALDVLRSLEHSDYGIKTIIMKKYNLTEEKVILFKY